MQYQNSKTWQIAKNAIYIALAFIFSYIESLFPLPIPFPGIKLGLANLIVLIILYKEGFLNALSISLIRNLLNALTFGSLFGFFYSLAGSILSLLGMWSIMIIYKKINEKREIDNRKVDNRGSKYTLIGASAIGGILHNMGQFLVACILVNIDSVIRYLPFLYFAGLIAGILIGIVAKLVVSRLSE